MIFIDQGKSFHSVSLVEKGHSKGLNKTRLICEEAVRVISQPLGGRKSHVRRLILNISGYFCQ